MGAHDIPRARIHVVFFTSGDDGKPVPTGEFKIFEIPGAPRENYSGVAREEAK
jgi:hypothetical protein